MNPQISQIAQKEQEREAQIVNYLKATGDRVGLLLNFGSEFLQYKRFVFYVEAVGSV